jgi:hypothetical protein
MKKIFLGILTIFLIFSIENVFAKKNWLIEDLLDLNNWPLIYDLNLEKLDKYSFKDKNLKNKYLTLVWYDKIIRNGIIYQYQKWTYSTATIKWIIRNYKSFVYYTNQLFYLFKQVEKYPHLKDDVDMQDGILMTYKNVAWYYKKVKNLVFEKE